MKRRKNVEKRRKGFVSIITLVASPSGWLAGGMKSSMPFNLRSPRSWEGKCFVFWAGIYLDLDASFSERENTSGQHPKQTEVNVVSAFHCRGSW